MNDMLELTGDVRVALPPDDAVELFTPEGERSWVPGWAPRYPGAGVPGCRPGTVFVTESAGRVATWIVVRADGRERAYARVVPGVQAGTVSVHCRPEGDGTLATVTYRTTPLGDAAHEEVAAFAAGFPAYLAEWERRIAAVLANG